MLAGIMLDISIPVPCLRSNLHEVGQKNEVILYQAKHGAEMSLGASPFKQPLADLF